MKMVLRLMLVILLGAVAAVLDLKFWSTLRTGHPYTSPIMGVMTRRGVISADPVGVLFEMIVLFNGAFLVAVIAWFAPGTLTWLRKKQQTGPPAKEPDAPPSWICPHCRAENPGNFEECWKCQKMRSRGHSA